MEFVDVFHDYGWSIVLFIFVIDKVWPWLTEKYIPDRNKQIAHVQERIEKLEERQVAAYEKMAEVQEAMSHQIIVINERLAAMVVMDAERDRALKALIARIKKEASA